MKHLILFDQELVMGRRPMRPLQDQAAMPVDSCRGIRPLSSPQELDAELYWPEDLDVKW